MTDAPAGKGLPPGLSAAKAALLEQRLKAALEARERKEPLPRRPPGAPPAPLSFAQQRLWFLAQWDRESPLYNVPVARRLRGPPDAEALQKALSGLVARHEALRTTVAVAEGEPTQKVWAPEILPLPLTDIGPLPESLGEQEAARLAAEEARRPLNLTEGPVLRARLLRLSPEDHLLVLVVHHVAFDGWSANLLDQELAVLYSAACENRAPALPPLSIQYGDYAEWQRRHLAGGELERGVAFWRTRLAGAPVLDLPTDKPRPPVRTNRGARLAFALPADTRDRLRSFCRAEAVTPYMPLLAAYKAALHAWTGATDLCVGTPIAGRTRAETEPLIGFFVNTLVLRTDLSDDPTCRALLARVRETCLGAYSMQEIPFEKLVEVLQTDRDPSRTPLFQVMFAHHVAETRETRWGPLAVTAHPVELGVAKFDLGLYFTETPTALEGSLEYNTDLLEHATAERFTATYLAALDALLANPEERLSHLTSALPLPTRRTSLEAPTATIPSRPALPAAAPASEARLAEIWTNLLGQAPIRPEDNFFHLGGHSLLAMKLAARIQTTFGVELPLPTLFAAQTLREMAHAIEAARPGQTAPKTIRPAGRGQYRVGGASVDDGASIR